MCFGLISCSDTPPPTVKAPEPVVVPEPLPEAEPDVAVTPSLSTPLLSVALNPDSGALNFNDAAGVLKAGLRVAVRASGGKRVSDARVASAANLSIHKWRIDAVGDSGWRAVARVKTAQGIWDVTLSQLGPSTPIEIAAEVLFPADTVVGQAALVLRFSGLDAATVLNRAYREVPVASGHTVDVWTPQRVGLTINSLSAQLEARAQSMRLEGEPATVFQVVLDADNQHNHPFRPFKTCADVYDPEVDAERSNRSPARFKAGDKISLSARIHLDEGPPALPLRFPQGRRAALVFTDHADQSSLARMRALMYGRSSGPRTGGFVGNGLALTKSVFHQSKTRRPIQLSEPDYAAELRELVAHGIEVGPHSVGDGPDKREKTEASLEAYRNIGGAPVWIDHQPTTNCEALSSEGAVEGSRFYLTDLLRQAGYRYAWAGTDVREPSDGINLFDPDKPSVQPAILYVHSSVDPSTQAPIRLFSSVWRYHTLEVFLDKFADAKLDKLESDRGLHIAHTYLDSASQSAGHKGKSLMTQDGGGYVLRPEVEAWLAGLSKRQKAGRLWVTGVVAMGDHLVGMSEVQVDSVDGGLRIRSGRPVAGASFLLESTQARVRIDGNRLPPSQIRNGPEGTVFWTDLLAGSDHLVTWQEASE